MKASITLFTTLFLITLLTGCAKNTDQPETKEERVVRLLTGIGNKVWNLKEVYVNDVRQTLTDYQLKYTITFTSDPSNADPLNSKTGGFTDRDGIVGTWKLRDAGSILEMKFSNNPAGPYVAPYAINAITENVLDIEYTNNQQMKSERKVFYAY